MTDAGDRGRGRRRVTGDRPAGPTSTSTRSPRTGRPAWPTILDHVGGPAAWTSSPSPTTSASTPRSPPAPWPRTAASRSRSSSARRSRPSAATCSACSSTARSGRTARCARRSRPSTMRAASRSPPTARALPAVRPGLGRSARLLDDADAAVRPDAIETFNPTALGRPWHDRVVRFADEHGLAERRQQRRPCRRRDRRRLDDVPGPHGRRPARGDRRGATTHHGGLPRRAGQVGVFGRSCASAPATRATRSAVGSGATARAATTAIPAGAQRPPRYDPGGAGPAVKIGLVSPYIYPDTAASPSTSASSTRTSACAATTSAS